MIMECRWNELWGDNCPIHWMYSLPCRGSVSNRNVTAKTTCKLVGKPIGETKRGDLDDRCPFKDLALP